MVVKCCVYPGCGSDNRKLSCIGVRFLPFPKPKTQLETCQRWIKMLAKPQKEFNIHKINQYTYICSKHFVGGDGPTQEYPDPIPAQSHGSIGAKPRKARKPPRDRSLLPIKKSKAYVEQLPQVSITTTATLPTTRTTIQEDHCYHKAYTEQLPQVSITTTETPPKIGIKMEEDIFDDGFIETFSEIPPLSPLSPALDMESPVLDMEISLNVNNSVIFCDASNQSSNSSASSTSVQATAETCDRSTQTDDQCDNWLKRKFFVDAVTSSDKNARFWTGIETLTVLNFVFEYLLPCAQFVPLWMGKKRESLTKRHYRKTPKKRTLSFFEEFIMTLVRIRRGLDTEEMAYLFGVTQSQVTHVFLTWINIMYKCCHPLLIWPSKDLVQHNMPKSFKLKYPSTRVIIDCSEIFIQTPRSLDAQRATYSSYKSHNTFKFLLGIAPSGQITFLSALYVGSISDREIVKRSGFLRLIEWKDHVMADRGFTIRDLLLRKNAYLNMPAFSNGKQLPKRAAGKSTKVSSVRIHVERAMERLKNNKILQGIVPLQLKNSMNQIMVICAVLSNLEAPLVK